MRDVPLDAGRSYFDARSPLRVRRRITRSLVKTSVVVTAVISVMVALFLADWRFLPLTAAAVGPGGEGSNASGIDGNQGDSSAAGSGAVYVFARSAGTWSQQAYVKASNTEATDLFGRVVALSADGNWLAAGALAEDSSATGIGGNQTDNTAIGAGAVYVFQRVGTTWAQHAYVKASNPQASDNFGSAVALSGDGATLAVAAVGEDSNATGINGDQTNNGLSAAGAVYVFSRSGGTWSQQAYAKASNPGALDFFGTVVALSGDGSTLAVGATGENSAATGINGDQTNSSSTGGGAAYVFVRSGTTWSQQAYVKASNTGSDDRFGFALSLSADGNTLAAGAHLEDSNALGVNGDQANNGSANSGAVYTFRRAGTMWSQQLYVKASKAGLNDRFGSAVALNSDGATLAVGAPFESNSATGVNGNQFQGATPSSGAVYVY